MRLWVEPAAIAEIASLPGNMRQRVRRAIKELPNQPRPAQSRKLDIPPDLHISAQEPRRLRMDHWRIIYVIDGEFDTINVLAVRRRPPYNYEDLQEILG